jgi:hypothetical protein
MLSPTEKKIVKNYDKGVMEQIKSDQETADRPTKKASMDPLLDALENEALLDIREANFEIGVFLKCRETFKIKTCQDYCDFFIRLARYKIEENLNDITRWRSYKKEFCRV